MVSPLNNHHVSCGGALVCTNPCWWSPYNNTHFCLLNHWFECTLRMCYVTNVVLYWSVYNLDGTSMSWYKPNWLYLTALFIVLSMQSQYWFWWTNGGKDSLCVHIWLICAVSFAIIARILRPLIRLESVSFLLHFTGTATFLFNSIIYTYDYFSFSDEYFPCGHPPYTRSGAFECCFVTLYT